MVDIRTIQAKEYTMSLPRDTVYYNNAPVVTTSYPGKTMGLVGMILTLVNFIFIPTALIGLILGYVAKKESKDAGFDNGFALTAIIIGWIIVGLSILFVLSLMGLAALGTTGELSSTAGNLANQVGQ